MNALIIVAAILAVLAAILSIQLRLRIIYSFDGLEVFVKVLFFRFYLVGGKEKRLSLRNFKIKRFRRIRDKRLKKYFESKAEKKKERSDDDPGEKSDKSKKKRFSSPREFLDSIRYLLKAVLERFPKYMHIDIKRLVITVGGNDAHQTAIMYGTAVQGLQYLIIGLGKAATLRPVKHSDVGVTPNFLSKDFSAEADITARIRVFRVLILGLIFIKNYLTRKTKRK